MERVAKHGVIVKWQLVGKVDGKHRRSYPSKSLSEADFPFIPFRTTCGAPKAQLPTLHSLR